MPVSDNLPDGICTPPSLQGTRNEIGKKYSAQPNHNNDLTFNTVGFATFSYHLFFNKCFEANNVPDFITINNKEYVFATHAISNLFSGTSSLPTFYDKIKQIKHLDWKLNDDYILLPSQDSK